MILDIGVHLNPEFNIEQELSPFLVRIAQKNTFSATSAKKASVSLLETTDAVLDMPRHLNLMLNRFSSGTFRLELVDKDIREFQTALDSASDKLMLGLVVGSLVVGSSLVLSSNPLPLPPEVSWLAVAGYSAAALTVLYVVYHVIYLRFRER